MEIPTNSPPAPNMSRGTTGLVGSCGDMDELRYNLSFPGIPNKTPYLDVLRGVDVRKEEAFQNGIKSMYGLNLEAKGPLLTSSNLMATGTTYSATSGSIPVLLPTWVDQKLYDITLRDTPLASGLIPRVTNNGLFADYVRRATISSAVWNVEGAALTSVQSGYDRHAMPIKYAYAVGEVSGPMMVASKVWQNALQLEMEAQYRSLKYLEETAIINSTGTGTTYGNAFTGFIGAVTTNVDNGSGTSEIELADLDTAFQTIREAYGHPNLIVTDWRTYNRLKQLLRPYLRYGETNKLNFGFEAMEYENIPIIPDLFMPTTGTGRELHIYDTQTMNNVQMRVLQEATMEELAKTADSYKFMIKLYETMIFVNQLWCYRFYNLP